LDHFEGRSWRGFHHHACLVMVAFGFLELERDRAAVSPPVDVADPAEGPEGKKARGRRRSQCPESGGPCSV
jgi:hypothetical protein